MGNLASYDVSCPPGGALIMLQDPETCFTGKPVLEEVPKPVPLAALSDEAWASFVGTVGRACGRCWDERLPYLGVPLLLAPLLSTLLALAGAFGSSGSDSSDSSDSPWDSAYFTSDHGLVPVYVAVLSMGLGLATLFLGRGFICHQNQKQDRVIRRACQELSSSSNGAVSAEYRTRWTGACKPKWARTLRLIALSPVSLGAPLAPLTMAALQLQGAEATVTAPPGSWGGCRIGVLGKADHEGADALHGIDTAPVPCVIGFGPLG